ncbi:MAG: hypothetical protein IJI46_10270 [Erysipelotrichaceae bacterium]|nr:hypothetical protein [Erysipelotrichaceae bacterium]
MMNIQTLCTYLIWFMVYSFFGWIYESLLRSYTHKRWYNSGFLNGPYIPIYGCGAVMDIFFLSDLKEPFLIFLYAAIINCILEYITSYVMELLFHARWWDYSKKPLNLNGRIYYGGFLAFGIMAMAVVLYVHPFLKAHTTDLMDPASLYVCASLVVIMIFTDTYITVTNMKDLEEKLTQLTIALEEARVKLESDLETKLEELPEFQKIRELRQRFNFQEKRLLDAFPDLKFKEIRYTAKEIRDMIRQENKKLFAIRKP